MSDGKPYLLVRTFPVGSPTRCQGKTCENTVEPPGKLSLVVDVKRSSEDVNGPAVNASLCDECVARIGDRLDRLEFTGAATRQIPDPDEVPDPKYPPF